jgi:hypothetical protein
MTSMQLSAPVELIESKIFIIREQKVMLSMHLAELYEVEPRILVRAVKRNIERFPEDFMFQLNAEKFANPTEVLCPLPTGLRANVRVTTRRVAACCGGG